MRTGINPAKLVADEGPKRKFDGHQRGEGCSSETSVKLVQSNNVSEAGPGNKIVLPTLCAPNSKRVPIPTQTIIIDPPQSVPGGDPILDLHPTIHEQCKLLVICLEHLDRLPHAQHPNKREDRPCAYPREAEPVVVSPL